MKLRELLKKISLDFLNIKLEVFRKGKFIKDEIITSELDKFCVLKEVLNSKDWRIYNIECSRIVIEVEMESE